MSPWPYPRQLETVMETKNGFAYMVQPVGGLASSCWLHQCERAIPFQNILKFPKHDLADNALYWSAFVLPNSATHGKH